MPSIRETFDLFFNNINKIDTSKPSDGVDQTELTQWLKKNPNPDVDILIIQNFSFFAGDDKKITGADIVSHTITAPNKEVTSENVNAYLTPLKAGVNFPGTQPLPDKAPSTERYTPPVEVPRTEDPKIKKERENEAISRKGIDFVTKNMKDFKLEKPEKTTIKNINNKQIDAWIQKGTYKHPETNKTNSLTITYSNEGTDITLNNYNEGRNLKTMFSYGAGFRGQLEINSRLIDPENNHISGRTNISLNPLFGNRGINTGEEDEQKQKISDFIEATKKLRTQFSIPQILDEDGNDRFPEKKEKSNKKI
ncbi:MAG: hypothetical protein ACK5T0_08605 [Vampirovibrionales bacterium]